MLQIEEFNQVFESHPTFSRAASRDRQIDPNVRKVLGGKLFFERLADVLRMEGKLHRQDSIRE
jgi:hypothetical protein